MTTTGEHALRRMSGSAMSVAHNRTLFPSAPSLPSRHLPSQSRRQSPGPVWTTFLQRKVRRGAELVKLHLTCYMVSPWALAGVL